MFKDVIPSKNATETWLEIGDYIDLNGIDGFIQKHNIADENFKKFWKDIGNAKFDMQDYQQWLIDNGKATSSFASFTAKAGNILKSFGASLASIGVNMLIGMALDGIATSIDNYIHRVDKANETIDNARSEYENSKSEIESTNAELEETRQKISELESKGVLSFTDEAELDKLKQQNDELEKNILLQEKKKENEAKQVVNEISENQSDLFDDFENITSKYSTYKSEYEEQDKIGIEGVKNGEIEAKDYEATMNSMNTVLTDYESALFERIDNFEKYKSDIVNKYGTDDVSQYSLPDKKLYHDINEKLNEAYHVVYSDAEYNKAVIEPIFKTDEFAGLYDQMLKFFVSGGSADLSSLEDKFGADIIQSLRNACENSGVDFDKVMGDIYANSQRRLDQIAPVFEKPNSSYEAGQNAISHSIRDFIQNGLSEEDRTLLLYADIPEEQKFKTIRDVKNFINSLKKASGESDVPSPNSFSEAWDSIGTSGDETSDKKDLAEKERLEELAAAGKLTEKELRNSSLADVFKDAGVSIEEATEKINKMKSSAGQLASMKTGISSISSILAEKEAGNDINADTLSGMPDDLKAQTKEYEHFVKILGEGSSTMDECRDAADKLATAYVNSNNFLANLTDGTKDYYISVLDEMGVENAAEVVTNALNRQKVGAEIATFNLKNATKQEIDQLGTYISSLDGSSKALGYYTLQQQIANNNALDTSDSIKHLKSLAKQCGITGEAISLMSSLAKDMKKVDYYTTGEGRNDKNAGIEVSNAQSEIEGNKKRLKKIINKGAEIGTSPKGNSASPKDSGSTSNEKNKDKSKSTQQIDWINRALDRLSTRLDLVKTKYDNLFNNKKAKDSDSLLKLQNKNLNDQYKILTKTEKYQDKAAKKYSKKAKKVSISKNEKENESLKKAVREGRINGKDTKKLIASYGEKKAGKIQEYQDWYDKSQEQKKNKISTQQAKRENRIQQYQNLADNADSQRELTQAKKENEKTAESKNKLIDTEEITQVKASYDYQIKIAKLRKDSLKVQQLQAEKEKELLDLEIEQHQNLADKYQSTL